MCFIIISKCIFYKQERTHSGGQVVISAPVGWEGGGGDITGRDSVFYHHFQMQLLQTKVDFFGGAGSNFCPSWLGMGWWGQYRPGILFIIISKCSFCKQEWTYSGGQVVISTPVGWEWGGGDSTGHDNPFHHHFHMQLLQTRVDMTRGQVVISAPDGCDRGGGRRVGGNSSGWTIRFIIISKCSFCKQEWTYVFRGQVVISAPVGWGGVVGWGHYRPGQCVSSSFPIAASTNKGEHVQGGR
jgi:hypothetical protein